uniref:CRISPR-associated exonuclease Cas4 n=2 Tax=Halalkalibacterium halodurans TaxID=86665 RepID=UPI002223EDEF|nr:Chain I, CRISPR-associated exonuclease Cas4 [Halalkalibacterium halodurans C-125]8D3L_J Chain J, CRISPR-associated exonuclease Cas4 [Halalkalibacterium halodurans C-125]8D3M_I Chain I, CRISPR-associated exonuclease Cas4 [Halalkalibacterium halodurans C-125]8D3P_I Chain I, CRISPR-associated exonuclease Cas4 [Halalkalibacterium halodurans C-125]8D3Q_I Chain I, CRISPR-associated exonuclease Cas4 [Halalkalibacterium halodurans C-125]8D3Q_J Chain J, CRISPR-associated exonuclease Cas4 [Halalkalib
ASNEEDRYLMLSGLQHFQFCKRQWALIHIEQQWEENVRTIEGQHLHKKADQPFMKEKRGSKLTVRAMPIQSKNLQISGICDVVEFVQDSEGIELSGVSGSYKAFPVEYKRGKPKKGDEDIVQLVAQAMCLEEMLVCRIDKGYLFYNEIKHRVEVPITDALRDKVVQMAKEMHHYYENRHTPKVKTGPFCNNCSLQSICLPKLMNKRSVKRYIEGRLSE